MTNDKHIVNNSQQSKPLVNRLYMLMKVAFVMKVIDNMAMPAKGKKSLGLYPVNGLGQRH